MPRVKKKGGGWYKTKDGKGLGYAPFPDLIRRCFPLDENPEAACDFLNRNPGCEMLTGGRIAADYQYPDHGSTEMTLPSGSYYYEGGPHSTEYLRPLEKRSDSFVRLGACVSPVLSDIRTFLENEKPYRSLGLDYRRGILLHGKPGNGKSLLLRDIIRNEIPADSVVIYLEKLPTVSFLQGIRRTLQDRLKVVVFEELNAVVNESRIERVLDFLDGETSLDNLIVLATTNYPERLPGNLVDRPSRFDLVYQVNEPDFEARRTLLQFYLRRPPDETLVQSTEGLSIADLKEIVLLNQLQGLAFPEAVERLRAHHRVVEKHFAQKAVIGIRSDDD